MSFLVLFNIRYFYIEQINKINSIRYSAANRTAKFVDMLEDECLISKCEISLEEPRYATIIQFKISFPSCNNEYDQLKAFQELLHWYFDTIKHYNVTIVKVFGRNIYCEMLPHQTLALASLYDSMNNVTRLVGVLSGFKVRLRMAVASNNACWSFYQDQACYFGEVFDLLESMLEILSPANFDVLFDANTLRDMDVALSSRSIPYIDISFEALGNSTFDEPITRTFYIHELFSKDVFDKENLLASGIGYDNNCPTGHYLDSTTENSGTGLLEVGDVAFAYVRVDQQNYTKVTVDGVLNINLKPLPLAYYKAVGLFPRLCPVISHSIRDEFPFLRRWFTSINNEPKQDSVMFRTILTEQVAKCIDDNISDPGVISMSIGFILAPQLLHIFLLHFTLQLGFFLSWAALFSLEDHLSFPLTIAIPSSLLALTMFIQLIASVVLMLLHPRKSLQSMLGESTSINEPVTRLAYNTDAFSRTVRMSRHLYVFCTSVTFVCFFCISVLLLFMYKNDRSYAFPALCAFVAFHVSFNSVPPMIVLWRYNFVMHIVSDCLLVIHMLILSGHPFSIVSILFLNEMQYAHIHAHCFHYYTWMQQTLNRFCRVFSHIQKAVPSYALINLPIATNAQKKVFVDRHAMAAVIRYPRSCSCIVRILQEIENEDNNLFRQHTVRIGPCHMLVVTLPEKQPPTNVSHFFEQMNTRIRFFEFMKRCYEGISEICAGCTCVWVLTEIYSGQIFNTQFDLYAPLLWELENISKTLSDGFLIKLSIFPSFQAS
ncbi:hypothetical protein PCE1_001224 [Barthelona sp. PCE]